ESRGVSVFDFRIELRVGVRAELRVPVIALVHRSAARRGGGLFDERIPGTALRAAAQPLRRLGAAFLADEDRLRWLHASLKASGIRPKAQGPVKGAGTGGS